MLNELLLIFCYGYFIEMVFIRIMDEILFKMDNDEVMGLVFVDFCGVFDIIII